MKTPLEAFYNYGNPLRAIKSARGQAHSKTLRDFRQVVECGSPLPLSSQTVRRNECENACGIICRALILLIAFTIGTTALAAGTDTNAPVTNVVVVPTNAPVTPTNAPTAKAAVPPTNAPDAEAEADLAPTNAVRMNFHDVPLNTVLNYLSKRMGFVVVADAEIHGNATIVSEQPVGTNEVIKLLSSALAKNNYSVVNDGRTLTINTLDNTKFSSPVNHPNGPQDIPLSDEMATDILPVHTLNPTQLVKDLDQVIPPGVTVSANEAGNAVIMTGRQKDIHRFAEIIAALDSTSISEVEVFVLKFADSKSVSDELKEIFQSPDSNVERASARTRFAGRGGGFGGFPGFGGGGGGGGNDSSTEKNASDKAVFTSDDQMNAVIASAPPDYFPMITNVIDRLDQPTSDITMIRVFHLKYSDPTETANELTSLFPDPDSTTSQNGRTMGTRFLPPWMQPQANASTKSDRMTRASLVRVVPDPRTSSIIVTTSKDLMDQISDMIATLDKDPAQTQGVYVFNVNNADPQTVQAAMTGLFPNSNNKNSQNQNQQSALLQRQQSTAQSQTSTTGTSGFGTTGGGGGLGGGGVP